MKPFFCIRENFFRSFCTKFLSLLYMRSLAYKIFHCLSANHNPESLCVICTSVTLFALVLRLNCTTVSQSESSNFFMFIITIINTVEPPVRDHPECQAQAAVAYGRWSLTRARTILGQNFYSLEYGNWKNLPHEPMPTQFFIHAKTHF